MGLSFSVPEGVKVPSSLVNIFKELHQDLGCSIPTHGNLQKWALQVQYLTCAWLMCRDLSFYKDFNKGNVDPQVIIAIGTLSYYKDCNKGNGECAWHVLSFILRLTWESLTESNNLSISNLSTCLQVYTLQLKQTRYMCTLYFLLLSVYSTQYSL